MAHKVEYSFRHEFVGRLDIRELSDEDLERLAQDAIRHLLLSDRLNEEAHTRFRNFLATALDETN